MTESLPPTPEQPQLGNLARLHRMSRTAGVGSTDYAAVNTLAVVAVVLGGLSFAALWTSVLLIIPVLALVVSVVAIKQVLASNGTQTGLAIAIAGLLLGLGFAGGTGYRYAQQSSQAVADRNELSRLIDGFGKKLADEDYAGAYAMFDARLKERMTPTQFETFMRNQFAPFFGKLTSAKTNGLFDFEKDPDTGLTQARGMVLMHTEKVPEGQPPMRPEFFYRKSGDQWQILNIPDWVSVAAPAPKPGQPAAPAGPSGPPAPAGPR
jgi:hypothetical protein